MKIRIHARKKKHIKEGIIMDVEKDLERVPFMGGRHGHEEKFGDIGVNMNFQPLRQCLQSHLINSHHLHFFVYSIYLLKRPPPLFLYHMFPIYIFRDIFIVNN